MDHLIRLIQNQKNNLHAPPTQGIVHFLNMIVTNVFLEQSI